MTGSIKLYTSYAGITHTLREETDGSVHIDSTADVQHILDHNKTLANAGDGYSPSREMRRAASIPMLIIFKWLNEEGWNALNPHHGDKLAKKLDDPDWAWLRTAPGRIGKQTVHV